MKMNLYGLSCFVVYIHVLGVYMRSSVRFCIYHHIQNYVFATLFEQIFFRNDGDAKPVFLVFFKLLLWPWDLSKRVERQKLMLTIQEETALRPENGDHIEGAS